MTSTLVNHQMDQIYRSRYGEHDESDEDDTRYYRYYVNKVKKEQGGEEEDLEEKEESTDTEEDIGYNNYPSTSEGEEECYKPDDTNTYDNYEDDDEGEEEEDGEGYVCPTCGTHSQPDERDKFRGEDLHDRSDEYHDSQYDDYVNAMYDQSVYDPEEEDHGDRSDEYQRYVNEMCEGSEFHVDAYIKRRNYAMCGDDLDVDKDDENTPIVFICAALYKRAVPCNFFSMKREEVFEHLQNDHFTSNYGLIHTYARVYTC